MILGFKDRFVPYVLDGSKTHTIRAGQRWRADMRADLFAKVRQKGMTLLFRAPVVRVEEIEISFTDEWKGYDGSGFLIKSILVNGCELSADEANQFAYRDGFRSGKFRSRARLSALREMSEYWEASSLEPFHGQIVHWDYAERYVPCADCGRSHPLGPCNAMFRSDWRLPRPTRAVVAAR